MALAADAICTCDDDGADEISPCSGTTTVCVMDASGRLGSTLVHRLLHRGYAVHAALQTHHTECFDDELVKKKKVSVFRSDPFDYHSIMDALEGCSALFYSFEPPSDHPTYDEFMAEAEVRAAHNVLEACAQTDTIHKVVFTSSVTAVIWRDDRTTSPSSSHEIDERNWSDVNFCKKFKLWHALSKTLAEKTAWALAMDRGLNMVSVNGGLLMSPDLTITNPYLKGTAEMYQDGLLVTVDLKFLVDAHISVLEEASSYGRYVCFDRVINCYKDAVGLARMLLPPSQTSFLQTQTQPQTPSFEETETMVVYQQKISNEKLNKLMVDFDTTLQLSH
ncbi:cinnamoyl-CoA reductase-like SNL6 isoform X2 [Malus sylvestris]|uniref:cinnamoyl-CoA reductase-like SNL6 isoform X2 n=1 Tax=Malus sylvestris TaxID=3752 RepID=UPI0021AC4A32|nr:cinnamoyl-CoA reductase-like SNL6 isoform X2 [Malus sylvestris]